MVIIGSKEITLKMATNAVQLTVDGKQRLDLSNMQITTFPSCILKFCTVDELDLSHKMLKKIPNSIDIFVNLRWLDLHSNQLDQLPEAIWHLLKLHKLNLCNKLLTAHSIPHELSLLRNLWSLNLGLNHIKSLPPSMGALKELHELSLFNNLLMRLPQWLHQLPNQHTLNVKCNPFPPEHPLELDSINRVDCLYVVRETCLCSDCCQKCNEEKGRMESRTSIAPVQRTAVNARLASPNSVAQTNHARC
uniref:Leucine rich repeat containing 18b n=1 Tax=Electrophorus electricus TaxID=8005 RepID=A0A4W4E1E4_ELEEL